MNVPIISKQNSVDQKNNISNNEYPTLTQSLKKSNKNNKIKVDDRLKHSIFDIINRINTVGNEYKEKELKSIQSVNMNTFIRNYIYPIFNEYNVNINYDKNENDNILLLLCKANDNKSNLSIPFVKLCNGLILEINFNRLFENNASKIKKNYTEFNEHNKKNEFCSLICCPSNILNTKLDNVNAVNKIICKSYYDIYEADDGTVINFYYHNNEWVISTRNSIDIRNVIWKSITIKDDNGYNVKKNITYNDIIKEVFEFHKFDINKLDKSRCYTFGVQHPIPHPTQKNKQMWFIQYCWLENDKIRISRNIDNTLQGLSYAKKIKNNNLYDLISRSKRAFNIFDTTGNKCFGYILRLKTNIIDENNILNVNINTQNMNDNDINLVYTDVFIESSLMSKLRILLYNNGFIKDKKLLKEETILCRDLDYVSWRSYLDPGNRKVFVKLIPTYIDKYKIYDNIFNTVLDELLTSFHKDDVKLNNNINKLKDNLVENTKEDTLNTIKDTSVDLTVDEKKSILRDILMNNKYAVYFYNIYNE